MCKNFMVIRHSIKELLAKSMVTRPMKCIVDLFISSVHRKVPPSRVLIPQPLGLHSESEGPMLRCWQSNLLGSWSAAPNLDSVTAPLRACQGGGLLSGCLLGAICGLCGRRVGRCAMAGVASRLKPVFVFFLAVGSSIWTKYVQLNRKYKKTAINKIN